MFGNFLNTPLNFPVDFDKDSLKIEIGFYYAISLSQSHVEKDSG